MQILKLHSFPLEQIGDHEGLEQRLGAGIASLQCPVRILAYSQRFALGGLRTQLRAAETQLGTLAALTEPLRAALAREGRATPADDTTEARTPADVLRSLPADDLRYLLELVADDPAVSLALSTQVAGLADDDPTLWATLDALLKRLLWRHEWLYDTIAFYEELELKVLRSATYVLLAWERDEQQGSALAQALSHTTGRPVELLDTLPPVLQCPYRISETRQLLIPEEPGYPFYTVLYAYDARGTWTAETLHSLLDSSDDVAVAIDMHTFPPHQAMRIADAAYTTAKVLQQDLAVKDTRAERVFVDAQTVMHRLTTEALHDVQIAVLVGGPTEEQVAAHATAIQHRMGSSLRLARERGIQGELIKFWSPTPRAQIDAPLRPRTMLSHGVGCATGILGFHRRSVTQGLLWGVDGLRSAPLFYDLFAHRQAAHMVVLGQSSAGKTFFLNVITARAAVLEGYRVIGIDAFKNGERVANALGAGARCHAVGAETPLNVLDIAVDPAAHNDWITPQVQHAIGQIAQIMGKPSTGAGDLAWIAYDFSNSEAGVIDRALSDLYAGVTPTGDAQAMPLLQDLIAALEQIQEPEARHLARELRLKLFGSTTGRSLTATGRLFNAPSGIDWDFSYDVNYYDFAAVYTANSRNMPLYYGQAIGKINRFMRDPRRDLAHKTLLLIDEFNYVTQVKAVARMAAEIAKVARKYSIGLLVADQNPITFLGNENGLFIFENAVAKILFHLDDHPARQMGEVIRDLQPEHIGFLTHAQRGQAVAVFGNDIHFMAVQPSLLELARFSGS